MNSSSGKRAVDCGWHAAEIARQVRLARLEDRDVDARLQRQQAAHRALDVRTLERGGAMLADVHRLDLADDESELRHRVDAVEQAVGRMQKNFGQLINVVMASDAFFPFPDSIEVAARAGVKWIVQPGGSVKDEEVKTAAKKHGIEMAITSARHFRH